MILGTKTQYSLVALTNIKNKNLTGQIRPVRLKEIAQEENISIHFLEQLFRKLRIAKIVKSIRGPGGGYVLATVANIEGAKTVFSIREINYKEVMDAVEEGITLNHGLGYKTDNSFITNEKLQKVALDLTKNLESMTI